MVASKNVGNEVNRCALCGKKLFFWDKNHIVRLEPAAIDKTGVVKQFCKTECFMKYIEETKNEDNKK